MMDNKNIQLWQDQLSEISKKIQGQKAEEWMTRGIIVTDIEDLNFVKKELDYGTLKQLHKVCELDIDASWSQCMRIMPEDNATGFWNTIVKKLNSYRDGLLVLNVSNIELFKLCWHLVQLAKSERVSELYAWCSDELFDPEKGGMSVEDMMEKWAEQERMRYAGKTDDEIKVYVDATLKSAANQHLKPSLVKFSGYVLINASALSWNEVCDYALSNNEGYFRAFMDVYDRVK